MRSRVGLVAETDPIDTDDVVRPGRTGERAVAGSERADSDAWNRNAANGSAALLADIVATDIDPLTLDDIEERVDALANGYFRTSPLTFRIAVVRLRQRVRDLVAARSTLSQRRRMYAALGALTGMLAESSFAIGVQTDIHCAAALALAEEAGHAGLVGWVRSTQAQIALHTGNPAAAARYACAGQAAAPRGSTAMVRSAAYLARANARMGNNSDARKAWRSTRSAWDGLDGALTDSVFSLSPEYLSYCELTMLVWLGDAGAARQLADKEEHAGRAPTVGRAIGQIDIGLARVLGGEVDEAVRAGHRALAIGGARLTTPLRDRFTDLIGALAPFDVPDVHELKRRWMWISA